MLPSQKTSNFSDWLNFRFYNFITKVNILFCLLSVNSSVIFVESITKPKNIIFGLWLSGCMVKPSACQQCHCILKVMHTFKKIFTLEKSVIFIHQSSSSYKCLSFLSNANCGFKILVKTCMASAYPLP